MEFFLIENPLSFLLYRIHTMVLVVHHMEEHSSLLHLEAGKVVGEPRLSMEDVSFLAMYLLGEEILALLCHFLMVEMIHCQNELSLNCWCPDPMY